MIVRQARPEDREAVAAFTQNTFEWGDYVPEQFDEWLESELSTVFVAADETDRAVALVRVVMMSPTEAWMHAARVHPEARRRGLGSKVHDAALAWAAERGAQVSRLLTETWNEPARGQVAKLGYRDVSRWVYAVRSIGPQQPNSKGNGGKRVKGEEQLKWVPRAEAEPAFLSWSTGDLIGAARGLFPIGWSLRRLTLEDLETAARRRQLWACPAGWVAAERQEDSLHAWWLSVSADEAVTIVRAVLDRAFEAKVERLTALVPDVGFLRDAFERIDAEFHPSILWELPI